MEKEEKIEWEMAGFRSYPKEWLIWLIPLALIIIAFLIFTKNFLGAIVIALGAIILYFYYFKSQENIKFILDSKGITIEKTFNSFSSLDYFRFSETQNEILIKHKKFYLPYLHLPFKDKNKEKIKNFLLKHLEEKE